MTKRHYFSLLILSFSAFYAHAQSYNIVDFGAKQDSTVLNTKAIQSAVDKCHDKGGGEVVVPAGTYTTGTILLQSNVYLHLMAGAVLQGSYNPADYPEHDISTAQKYGTITHNGLYLPYMKALIIAHDAQNVGIIGQGTLKGAGEGQAFQLGINKDGKPKNIFFIGCKDVLLRGVKIFNAAQICVSISGCERVNIDGIYIRSLVNWNCDGLDVDAKDVTISNSLIDSEDDALCFKSEYWGKFCENITVTNCVLSSLCNGIKLGTGSRTGFRNISINNCVIKKASFNGYRHWTMLPHIVDNPDIQSVNTGIVILGVDGGVVENISFSNITMTDVLSPFFIKVNKRFVTPDGKVSIMRHIRIQHVVAETRSILPCIVAGLEESPLEDVRISDVRISVPISVNADSLKTYPSVIPENTKGYPENRLTFGLKIPASAFYIRHVNGLELNDIRVTFKENDARPAVFIDDSKDIKLKSILIDNKKLENNKTMLVQMKAEKVEVTN